MAAVGVGAASFSVALVSSMAVYCLAQAEVLARWLSLVAGETELGMVAIRLARRVMEAQGEAARLMVAPSPHLSSTLRADRFPTGARGGSMPFPSRGQQEALAGAAGAVMTG